MSKPENTTIKGETVEDEATTPSKKKLSLTPYAKKALIVGGATIGLIIGYAVIAAKRTEIAEGLEDDVDIEMVDNPDGSQSLIITESA